MYNDIALGKSRRQNKIFGRLAQLVEHLLDVQVVSGSIPLTSTKHIHGLSVDVLFYFSE